VTSADKTSHGQPIVRGYEVPGDLHGESAVFGLLGNPAAAGRIAVQQSPCGHNLHGACEWNAASASGLEPGVTPDLIRALHDQYCRALDDPLAPLAGDWCSHDASADGPNESAPRAPCELEGPCPEFEAGGASMSGGGGFIEGLLSGVRTLEDCFGRLSAAPGPGALRDLKADSVPEILRLFAPPEYHAAASHRSAALPPALARREHHALGIDSPLLASVPATACQRTETARRESGFIEIGQQARAISSAETSLSELPACDSSVSAIHRNPTQSGGAVGTA
jgi:hypothetical protein